MTKESVSDIFEEMRLSIPGEKSYAYSICIPDDIVETPNGPMGQYKVKYVTIEELADRLNVALHKIRKTLKAAHYVMMTEIAARRTGIVLDSEFDDDIIHTIGMLEDALESIKERESEASSAASLTPP